MIKPLLNSSVFNNSLDVLTSKKDTNVIGSPLKFLLNIWLGILIE